MRKVIIAILALLLKTGTGFSQDVIIMRNADEISAKVLEVTDDKVRYKKFTNLDGPVYSISQSEIFMIKYENGEKDVFTVSPTKSAGIDNQGDFKTRGFTNITEFCFGIGTGEFDEDFAYGLHTVNGYLVNPHFSVGLGIGADKYKALLLVPIYADLRANILKGKVSPYVSLGAGYSVAVWNDFNHPVRGGVMVNPDLGVKLFVSRKTSLLFSIGYRLQGYSSASWYSWNDPQTNLTHQLSLKLGATF
jgi:hypothetical protein